MRSIVSPSSHEGGGGSGIVPNSEGPSPEAQAPILIAVRLGTRKQKDPDLLREINAVRVMNEDGSTREASRETPDPKPDLLDNALGVRDWWEIRAL